MTPAQTDVALLPCPFCGGSATAMNYTTEGAVNCACSATIALKRNGDANFLYQRGNTEYAAKAAAEAHHQAAFRAMMQGVE